MDRLKSLPSVVVSTKHISLNGIVRPARMPSEPSSSAYQVLPTHDPNLDNHRAPAADVSSELFKFDYGTQHKRHQLSWIDLARSFLTKASRLGRILAPSYLQPYLRSK